MARTSSLNCLSCRKNPYQTPDSLNCLPPFHWKSLFFTEKCSVASPFPKMGSDFNCRAIETARIAISDQRSKCTKHGGTFDLCFSQGLPSQARFRTPSPWRHQDCSRCRGRETQDPDSTPDTNIFSRWTFRIFFIFLFGGGEGGAPAAQRKERTIFYWKSQEGGGLRVGRGAGESVCREFGGWGLNIFFRGRKAHQVLIFTRTSLEVYYTPANTPWVDSACADCPGFLVLGAAPAPASTFISEPQIARLD